MTREDNIREIREARAAGQDTLNSLHQAEKLLDDAEGWGLFDIFGGGFISSMMKHSKISDANGQMEQAKKQVQIFQEELKDVNMPADFKVNVSEFLTFADFFFDGFIADWLVQSKIKEAKQQVKDAIDKINSIMDDLNRWEAQLS